MYGNRPTIVAALVVTLATVSCGPSSSRKDDDQAASKKESALPSSPVSGKTAFWEMYKSAHAWASDLVPLSLESKNVAGITNSEGKAGMWTAAFGSPSGREARVFRYALAEQKPDIFKGVTVDKAIPWPGGVPERMPFSTSDFSIDSDTAYQTASAQAASWLNKHPGKNVSLTLGYASRFPAPVWYVLWGDDKAGYAVYVNAKTGTIEKGK